MVRGTTPTFDFELENLDLIHDIEITFSQNQNTGTQPIQKELSKGQIEMHKDEGFVRCTLSQDDTFSFSVGQVRIQMRIVSSNGDVAASDIVRIKVEESLSEDKLSTTGGN
jgi:hypothetical protein